MSANAVKTPAKPETAKAETAKPADLVTLNYTTMVKMSADEQDRLMKGFNGQVKRLANTRKDVKTASKYAGKLLAAVEDRVQRGIKARIYASTYTASDLYKQVTGEKPPGHVWTLKNTYVNFVLTGLMTEADYDGNRNNCLELAQRIADAVFEADPNTGLKHDAVSRAAAELKTRTDEEAKVLRSILASVKPPEPPSADESIAAFEAAIAAGHAPALFAQLPEAFEQLTADEQKNCYVALGRAMQAIDEAHGETIDAWVVEAADAEKPVQFVAAGRPLAALAA